MNMVGKKLYYKYIIFYIEVNMIYMHLIKLIQEQGEFKFGKYLV